MISALNEQREIVSGKYAKCSWGWALSMRVGIFRIKTDEVESGRWEIFMLELLCSESLEMNFKYVDFAVEKLIQKTRCNLKSFKRFLEKNFWTANFACFHSFVFLFLEYLVIFLCWLSINISELLWHWNHFAMTFSLFLNLFMQLCVQSDNVFLVPTLASVSQLKVQCIAITPQWVSVFHSANVSTCDNKHSKHNLTNKSVKVVFMIKILLTLA